MNELMVKLALEEVEAQQKVEILADYEIQSDDDFVEANEVLKQVKGKIKLLDDERKVSVQPMNEEVKKINAWFKPAIDKLTKAEALLKKMIGAYSLRKQEEQRRLLAEAAEASRRALEARSVTDSGPLVPEEAIEKMEAAQAAAPTRVAGVSTKTVWDWELVDERQVPVEFKSVDKRKVDAAVKAGTRNVPGIRIFETVAVRASSK